MKHIHCTFFGHEYEVTEKITSFVNEYTCKNCKNQVTTDVNGKLIPLTPKFKEINSVLKRIHSKKRKRQALILDR